MSKRTTDTARAVEIRDAAKQIDLPGTAAPDERVSLREYAKGLVKKKGEFPKLSRVLTWLAEETGISRGTLHRHIVLGAPLSVPIANKVAAWSGGKVSAVKTSGASP